MRVDSRGAVSVAGVMRVVSRGGSAEVMRVVSRGAASTGASLRSLSTGASAGRLGSRDLKVGVGSGA